jgi:predicted MFS family arabinose efflux permease
MSTDPHAVGKNPGSFAPLRQTTFLVIWIATILGNTGSFMRDVASSWLVVELKGGPASVAMIQAAGTLPVFLLAIPAGVLSDILDRRKFLVLIQLCLAALSIGLMTLSHLGLLTIQTLITVTFLGGVCAALVGPTWQSIVPELVPPADLKNAVGLNSLGVNIARSIGPAAGGVLLASIGAAFTYGADVASDLVVAAALLWWHRHTGKDNALPEHFLGAFRAGLRYTRSSRPLHRVLLRAAVFFLFVSCVWALLPLVARNVLNGGAGFYGVLLGAVGAGAIGGAIVLPRLRQRLSADQLLLAASLMSAAAMVVLALAPPKAVALVALLALGAAWITALTTLNGVAQSILPNWVRGRGLAVYLMVFNGAMAGGSLGWGALAEAIGVPRTLWVGAALICVVALLMYGVRLPAAELDLSSSNQWPEPLLADPIPNDRGPVLIQIEYRIAPAQLAAFVTALTQLSNERRRDGAYAWGVTQDTADPLRLVEWFMVESWAEHLRQHHRFSNAGADLQHAVVRYHEGNEPPKVTHLLAIDQADVGKPSA